MVKGKRSKPIEEELNLPGSRTVPARLARRFFALVIDLIILWIISSVLSSFIPGMANLREVLPQGVSLAQVQSILTTSPELYRVMLGINIFFSAVFLLYFSLTQFIYGRTAGMHLLGLRVETLGKKLLWRYIVRNLWTLFFMPTLIMALWIIDLGYLAFSRTNQRLLEHWSGTLIKQRERPLSKSA
jgi:uncharacterized RDD family membrane protein YckC